MKVLMINYKFPPIKSIGAIRNYNVAEQFVKNGYSVVVLTTNNVKVMPLENLPNHTFEKHLVFTFDYKTVGHRLSKKNGPNKLSEATKSYPFFNRLKNSFPFNLFLDEGGLLYIFNAYRTALRLIKKGEVDIIYSSFRPYADHFVAYLLKRKFPVIKWIADFRDPPYNPARLQVVFFQKLQRSVTRKIMTKSDLVTTVSKGIARYFEDEFLQKTLVMRNSINPEFHTHRYIVEFPKLTFTYTGSLYAGLSMADPFFKALAALIEEGIIDYDHVQLVYAGNDVEGWNASVIKYGLEAIAVSLGQISMEEALALHKKSHVNLLLTWSGPQIMGILTGKQNEYFEARRPVLAIVNGAVDDEIEEIYEELNAGYVFSTNSSNLNDLKAVLFEWYTDWKKHGKIAIAYNETKMLEHYWDFQFAKLNDYITHNWSEPNRI